MKNVLHYLIVLIGSALILAAQTVNTIVSGGAVGLLEPYGVAVDTNQNLYITDSANHRIVRFNISSGELESFAGVPGRHGALDGPIESARFFDPKGILYLRGHLVVADSGNSAIRLINLTNSEVSTLAGRLGEAGSDDGAFEDARFYAPRGLAVDSAGHIYVADSQGGSIRKISTNGEVSTLVSGLIAPTGVAVDPNGKLFISDRGDNKIKLFDAGVLTTFAGNGSAGSNDNFNARNASFNSPENLFWIGNSFGLLVSDYGNHTLRRIYFNSTRNAYSVETYAGAPSLPGNVDGSLALSRLNLPAGIAAYSTGFLFVEEGNNSVKQILATPAPPQITPPRIGRVFITTDPDTGSDIAVFEPVVNGTFDNEQVIVIVGEDNVAHRYTFGRAQANLSEPDPVPTPTAASPNADKFISGSSPRDVPGTLSGPLPALTVKAISMSSDPSEIRTPSSMVSATFKFRVAAPEIDSTSLPGAALFLNATTNCTMWYTLDGSDPTQGTNDNPASLGPKSSGDSIPLIVSKTNVTIKVKAFKENFTDSATSLKEFSPENYTPNRITLGFKNGEASSDFVAAAGQRFYAPVSLSVVPNTTMYGLNFTLSVTNSHPANPGPAAADYGLGFQSMLYWKLPTEEFVLIPPMTLGGYVTNVSTFVDADGDSFFVTNITRFFTSLLSTNASANLLGVGWIERRGHTNLYSTRDQDLISYSIPHDTVFGRSGGRVVPGAFSFIIPAAATNGQFYSLQISRPSATADGISQDIFIEAPGLDDLSTDKAIRDVVVGTRSYIVGDVTPFRWLNAGDFGDTNILNNDLTQFQQSIVYGLNMPMAGSDFEDAFDTCCITTNSINLSSSYDASAASPAQINTIGYGDGRLTITDLFVAFRRAVDPNLVWYERYWSNAIRQARTRPNEFRGVAGFSLASLQARQSSDRPNGDPLKVIFKINSAKANPGQLLQLPLRASISGGLPIRTLLMRARVTTLDGEVPISHPVTFLPSSDLGAASVANTGTPASFGGAWLDLSRVRLSGESTLGLLQIPIPVSAKAQSAYQVEFEHISSSPDGIYEFPAEVQPGIITMKSRFAGPNPDGISNDWINLYFGSDSNPDSIPQADPDGDGSSNLSEFRAGTSPVDGSDALRLRVVANADNILLRWASSAGKQYQIQTSSDLSSEIWNDLNSQPITGNGSSLEINTSHSASARFYRIRLVP